MLRSWAKRLAILAAASRFLLRSAHAEAVLARIFFTVASSWEASLCDAEAFRVETSPMPQDSATIKTFTEALP